MIQTLYSQPVFDDSAVSASGALSATQGARLVAPDGRALPLEWTSLECEAGGGLCRSTLRQRFRNTEHVPLEVTYLVPLPADGAVSGYSFELAGVVTRGVVEKSQVARERYEEALMQGKSAALLEQERTSVFRQLLGNVPPGQHIDITLVIDQPLTWTRGGWELRFPSVVAPRYQNATSDGYSNVPVALGAEQRSVDVDATHRVYLSVQDPITERPNSPSHALSTPDPGDFTRVRIDSARLDRDVVIRWSVAMNEPGVRLETARPNAENPRMSAQYGLLTLTPPAAESAVPAVARDLIVLLDTSGSMGGEPLSQAVRIVSTLVRELGDGDRLELIEFGSTARRWKHQPVAATAAHKHEALTWLRALRAGGGTEMKSGIDAALVSLRPSALRQVILITDGLIGFEREILQTLLRRLPATCRLHTVGVGHGTNRSLLEPAARAGRGVEIIVTPGEDVEPACVRLLDRIARPLIVDVRVSGTALQSSPERPLDVYAGSPALIPLALRPEGGSLEIIGTTADGTYTQRLQIPARAPDTGPARLLALFARRKVEDIELARAAGNIDSSEADAQIESLGVDFQISTRLTSWVAISDTAGVDPTSATRRVEQPHMLPAAMSAEGLGLRAPSGFFAAAVGGGPMTPQPAFFKRRLGAAQALPPMAAAPSPAARGPGAVARPPREQDGIFQRVMRTVFGQRKPIDAGSFPFHARGIVRINNERRLSVSFTVADVLDWSLPERLTVELEDGQKLDLEVETSLSTKSARIEPNQEVRLVLRLAERLPARPRYVRLHPAGFIELVA